jgi:hypothetical protein
MRSEEAFAAWAPPEAAWSDWAKPVLFVHLDSLPESPGESNWGEVDASWSPGADERCAIVLDLPGPRSVALGIALARRGYRPVPLFNGCPGAMEAVPTQSVLAAIAMSTDDLGRIDLPIDAPPVFLLDAGRNPEGLKVPPGKFDNRWMTFPQDFPSANFLQSNGIQRVLLVQEGTGAPTADLAHVLLRWQESGIAMEACDSTGGGRSEVTIRKPRRYRSLWYLALAMFGFYRSSAGGFGSIVPQPSSGGS